MADYISRKDYVNRLNDEQVEYDEFYKGLGKAKVIADEMPSIDAVEVVRCEFCEHWDKHNNIINLCKVHKEKTGKFYFCASGVKKE